MLIPRKLYRCLSHGLNMCILFGYNPLSIFCYFFQVDLSLFSGIITCIIVGTLCAHLLQFYANCFETLQMFWSWSENGYIYWGSKSKRLLVKTPPSQNVPELVKTSPNTKMIGQNVPIKRPHLSKEIFRRNMRF